MDKSLSRWLATTVVVALLSLGSTAFGAPMAPGVSTESEARSRIIIDNDAYYPAMLRVLPGDTIAVTNREGEDHSLTAKDGAFDTGVYASGTRYIEAPGNPGRYPYSCLVHGPRVMKGILIVTY
jgi:plastocyanin